MNQGNNNTRPFTSKEERFGSAISDSSVQSSSDETPSGAFPYLCLVRIFLSKLVAGNLGSFSAPKDCYFDE